MRNKTKSTHSSGIDEVATIVEMPSPASVFAAVPAVVSVVNGNAFLHAERNMMALLSCYVQHGGNEF